MITITQYNYNNTVLYNMHIYTMYKMGKTLIMTQSKGKNYCLFFISRMPRVKLRKFYIVENLICIVKISPEL